MSEFNQKYKLGDAVCVGGKMGFVLYAKADSTSDDFIVKYGITDDLPAPCHYGNKAFVEATESDICSPEEWTNVRISRDGNMWCAVRPSFVNLHESLAGFGETTDAAITNLIANERARRLEDADLEDPDFQDDCSESWRPVGLP